MSRRRTFGLRGRRRREFPRLLGILLSSGAVTALAIGCSSNGGMGGSKNGTGANPALDGSGASAAQAGTTGTGGGTAAGSGGKTSDPNGSGGTGGEDVTTLNPSGETLVPFEKTGRGAALRKVKNLMTGLPPSVAEYDALAAVAETGDAVEAEALSGVMRELVLGFIETPQFQAKMIAHFRNVFQQKGFSMQEDMKGQFLEYGPFDLNPTFMYGDNAYTRFEKNFADMFAQTALAIVEAGEPFSNVLTTRKYMMTTAMMAAYLQIEMPNDAPLQSGLPSTEGPGWTLDPTRVIPLEEAVQTMTFDDAPPDSGGAGFLTSQPECDTEARLYQDGETDYAGNSGFLGVKGGAALLMQRLIGLTPRWAYAANPACFEHMSKPYFTESDTSDWRLIELTTADSVADKLSPWDIPALRAVSDGGTLALSLPRVGFYTTPAFLALWRTNDSNQHRVTANQAMIAAVGEGFTAELTNTPVSTVGLDEEHAATETLCYACHKSLDPLRNFWANQFDYNDRNDFADNQQGSGSGNPGFGASATSPRPKETGGAVAFENVNTEGADMFALGPLMLQITDANGLPRFAISMAQQLCYWADSAGCAENDDEFRRIVQSFVDSQYDFKVLVAELMSSPLVTNFANTSTFDTRNVVVSITRRDHLCAALGQRLDLGDVCGLDYAFPYSSGFGGSNTTADSLRAVFRIAGTIAADAFSRGSEVPVTPAIPTLFYAAGSELLCENVAGEVVGTVYTGEGDIAAMVSDIMGYPSSEPQHAEAVSILQEHYAAALAVSNADMALKSTFSLACQSPTSLGLGI